MLTEAYHLNACRFEPFCVEASNHMDLNSLQGCHHINEKRLGLTLQFQLGGKSLDKNRVKPKISFNLGSLIDLEFRKLIFQNVDLVPNPLPHIS